ncbi:carbonic anhydrase [Sediminibacillus dalangtanensis]|uniref:carbonic anhydrase n=1 Tax=Sediminibacillus dalangtanensis TaxID=2729421 RepID=A0ABX7VV89_9BACI|nr:carbonic anhydrase [Sediminibacillus dalangtanensis]QTM98531.1 carbonic anhydrase [Sediminibacillus dalangtanensis]
MLLENLLEYNRKFIEGDESPRKSALYPNKNAVVLTCMEPQLESLLREALDLQEGDVEMIKNAGAFVSNPYDSVMRSLLIAVYERRADEVFVIGHHDCWMKDFDPKATMERMGLQGVSEESIEDFSQIKDLSEWLRGYQEISDMVKTSVNTIVNHPLLPEDTPVHGLIIDPDSGKLDVIVYGF